MENFNLLLDGFATALTWENLLYCLIGVVIGMLVGILPGIGPTSAIAILIPITFGMDPVSAIIMLAGIFSGSMYGGTITSVLINTPGEAASVITCIDGYQMAKQGRAGTALGIAAIGSFIGGLVPIFLLVFVAPTLASFALRFGPPEYFALMLLGLMTLVSLMGKSIIKGLIAAIFGFLLALIGMDPVSGEVRFTFGTLELMRGIDFTVLAMGLFGISEILLNLEKGSNVEKPAKIKGLLPNRDEWKPALKSIARGTGIGTFLGLIPGVVAAVSSLISYTVEKKVAKNPSRFGKGAIEGVAGPDTANNAFSSSALIPLFSLGLPGSPTVAVLLGALILHGLTPGPRLFQDNPDFVWAVIASLVIGNVMLLILNLPLAKMWAQITRVPYKLLFPIVIIFCVLGAYTVNNSVWDVWVMLLFGVIGYVMKKLDLPMAATVLTFVLGQKMESSLLQSMAISNGSLLVFFQRPISGTIMVVIGIILLIGIYSSVKNKKKMLAEDAEI